MQVCNSQIAYNISDVFTSMLPVYKRLLDAKLKMLVFSGDHPLPRPERKLRQHPLLQNGSLHSGSPPCSASHLASCHPHPVTRRWSSQKSTLQDLQEEPPRTVIESAAE